MGVSKVTLNGDTLMDITSDTVDQSNLLTGFTAHGADGESVAGGYTPVTYDIATETTDGLMSSSDKVKLNGIDTGAEVNQNAFSNVVVGSTTIAADSKTDTLTLTAGDNITLTPNATNDSVTIAVNGTVTGVKGDSESTYRTGQVNITKTNIGLGNVENKSSATIRGELTQSNVTTALGYTPYTPAEVDALVSSVFHYKGSKTTYSQVAALTDMKIGDVWQVTEDNSEYVYNGTSWQKLGPTIDLSGYLASVSVAGQVLTPNSNSITVDQLKTALGLGTAAYAATASTVGNNSNLPTGAAVQSYVTGLGYTSNTGTVTKVTAGTGLSGGDITTSGTIALKGQNIYYATCPTAAGTAAKIVTTTNGDFELITGAMVRVKFTYADTYNGTSTLNVDSKGAKNIVKVGTTVKPRYYWQAGEVVDFVYDGTYFVMLEAATATTTYYGMTKLEDSTSSTSTTTAATPNSVKTAYDLAASKTDNTGTVTSVATGTGLTGGPITTSGTISLSTSGVTAGSAGPTAAVTGNEGTTVAIPSIIVDEYGRVTALTSYNLTNKNTTYTAATTAPGNVTSASAVGTSTNYARQDHTHGIALATGDSNGQVKVAGTNVSVKGWNTAATYDIETTVANDTKLPTGAAVKTYVDNAVASVDGTGIYVQKAGDTMTGNLKMSHGKKLQFTYDYTGGSDIIDFGATGYYGSAEDHDIRLAFSDPIVLSGISQPHENNEAVNLSYYKKGRSLLTATLDINNWETTLIVINNCSYYKCQATVTGLTNWYPVIYCGSSTTALEPSRADQEAFNRINYIECNVAAETITAYAIVKPTTNVYLRIYN